jgi:ribosomal protein S18 acetylase RimI-like enzyme
MNCLVRELNLDDLEEIYDLNLELGFNFPRKKLKERVEYLINRPETKVFVAEYNSKVIGYIHGSVSDRIYDDRLFFIHTVIVTENYRGIGVGNKLITKIEEWVSRNDYLGIGLWSRIDRIAAHKFYENHGYINERTQKYFLKHL